ncbi:hypothetical protein CDV36_006896 [Fusarium kuroshium]|uniref:Heterokaryon incompatibility domain-containing protein n=1 Tax=Fusarium kuroshium TaxID=2010991 RepID=A0A3M2S8I0_9HYPO|nr:hypothetical protein CDV36_006896 [Fusarium kuroshium]
MDSQTPNPQQHPDSLCERCKSIDFDAILSRQYDDGSGIVPLVNLAHLPLGDCALCQMFAQYRGDDWDGGVLCSAPLGGDTTNLGIGQKENRSRPRMLCILPTSLHDYIDFTLGFFRQKGYISEHVNIPSSWNEGPAGPRSLDPGVIDYSIIRRWFDFCQDNHVRRHICESSNVDPKWPIRFIDCETRLVVEVASLGSPCPPFLALSYVWGQHVDLQYRPPAHDEPLQDVPLTVEDSIVVTQKLGFRYLWVDKYCIRQDDEGDKRRQVPLMADIYGSAQITIIAVAGSDPSYGLPGVSEPRKIHQSQVRVGNHTLTWEWGSDPLREEIASSTWSTRGWTYQEGLLSTRRLVFTDQQVYFQCSRSSFYETLKIPFDRPNWTEPNPIFPCLKDTSSKWYMGVGDRIHEYTLRKLGNEDDILNAFQGLFSAFSKEPMSVYNIWGIPISTCYVRDGDKIRYPAHGFLANIFWTLETPADRRHNFPSWSWAGWKGVVGWKYIDFIGSIASNDTDITVSFESPAAGTISEYWFLTAPPFRFRSKKLMMRVMPMVRH